MVFAEDEMSVRVFLLVAVYCLAFCIVRNEALIVRNLHARLSLE